jgi:hypothetical protein
MSRAKGKAKDSSKENILGVGLIDVKAPTGWGLQPLLDPIPPGSGILKLSNTKAMALNHLWYFFKDTFAKSMLAFVIDPLTESKIAYIAFVSGNEVERVSFLETTKCVVVLLPQFVILLLLTSLYYQAISTLSSRKILGAEVQMVESTRSVYKAAQDNVRLWNWQERYYPQIAPPPAEGSLKELEVYTKQVGIFLKRQSRTCMANKILRSVLAAHLSPLHKYNMHM